MLILPKGIDRHTLAASSPAGFAHVHSDGRFQSPPHVTRLNQLFMDLATGRVTRALISMPPRHGKSELFSRYGPAWYLGTFPEKRFLFASYEATFASTFGAAARDILTDMRDYVKGQPARGYNSAGEAWLTREGGGMATSGVGGSITGKGANLIVGDDLIKNAKEASSKTIRESVKNWFKTTLFTRLEPNAALALIMTRWHEDDLIGYIQREFPNEGWQVLNIPALAEDDDALGRPAGAALWPERYNEAALASIKNTLGTYWFSAMYQGRPIPEGGGIFNRGWFKYYTELPALGLRRLWWSWDCAVKTGEENDFSVGTLWGEYPAGYFLIDLVRGRWEYPDLKRIVRMHAMSTSIAGMKPAGILVEDKSSGEELIQDLKRDRELKVPVIPFEVGTKDKVFRARIASPIVEAGRVHVPASAPWLGTFLSQVCHFPNDAFDDQVDSMVQYLIKMTQNTGRPVSQLGGGHNPSTDW